MAKRLRLTVPHAPRHTPAPGVQQRNNRAAASDVDRFQGLSGPGNGWARTEYGDYYATSVSVYAAVKLRADALSRPPVRVFRHTAEGARLPVERSHPMQELLDRVNPWFSRGDLWRATEIYLNLWGSAFWALERDENGRWEIWPLRPDRVSVLPDASRYVRGFVYQGRNGSVAYTPDEIVWFRYFNPLEEYAGLSPLAPVRLSVDMGMDGLKFNRNFLRNSAQPDFFLLTNETMTDSEVEEFYNRWEARFRGPANSHRPAIASFVRDIKTLGLRTDMKSSPAMKAAGTPREILRVLPVTVSLGDRHWSTQRRSSGAAFFNRASTRPLSAPNASMAAWDLASVVNAEFWRSHSSLRWARLALSRALAPAKASSDTWLPAFINTNSVSDSVTFCRRRSVASIALRMSSTLSVPCPRRRSISARNTWGSIRNADTLSQTVSSISWPRKDRHLACPLGPRLLHS
ncbi:MAG: phage portal protein [Chloroflexi bacterium]|nr:phage portal protein [Chloroflexota bacterium]